VKVFDRTQEDDSPLNYYMEREWRMYTALNFASEWVQEVMVALRLFWNGMRSWEGTGLADTPENRRLLEAAALVISTEIKNKSFDYIKHFPKGNKARLFRPAEQLSPSHLTVESYFKCWIKKQSERVRAHRVKDYETIPRHVLKARIEQQAFGKIALGLLDVSHLQSLQNKLRAKG
jgi:hypothetical protein